MMKSGISTPLVRRHFSRQCSVVLMETDSYHLIMHCTALVMYSQVYPGGTTVKAGVTKCLTNTKKKLEQEWKRTSEVSYCRKTDCLLFLSTVSLGVMATELLQYFMCCSSASHKAFVTTACTMLHRALFSHGITMPHTRYSTSSLKHQCCIRNNKPGTVRTMRVLSYSSYRRATTWQAVSSLISLQMFWMPQHLTEPCIHDNNISSSPPKLRSKKLAREAKLQKLHQPELPIVCVHKNALVHEGV